MDPSIHSRDDSTILTRPIILLLVHGVRPTQPDGDSLNLRRDERRTGPWRGTHAEASNATPGAGSGLSQAATPCGPERRLTGPRPQASFGHLHRVAGVCQIACARDCSRSVAAGEYLGRCSLVVGSGRGPRSWRSGAPSMRCCVSELVDLMGPGIPGQEISLRSRLGLTQADDDDGQAVGPET